MTVTLKQRNRRALMLLAVAAVLYVLASQVLFSWYDQLRAAPGQVSDKTGQLRKFRTQLSHRGNYEKLSVDTRKQIADLTTHFFSTDGSGPELQKLVEESAHSVGIDLMQRTVTETRKVDELVSETTMSVTFDSTPNQLVGLLTQLRAATKMVKVKSAQVDPIQPAFEVPKSGDLKKTLRVNMSIAGMVLLPVAQGKGK